LFKKIGNNISLYIHQETPAVRRERMLAGALYGIIAASAYAWTLSIVNVISIPGLHLAIDWTRLMTYWGWMSLALSLAGVIAGWFTEDHEGIIASGVSMGVLLIVGNLVVSLLNTKGVVMATLSTMIALLVVGAGFLIAWGLRQVINRHVRIQNDGPTKNRTKYQAVLAAIVLLTASIPGVLAHYDRSTVIAIRSLNEILNNVAEDPSLELTLPVAKMPKLKDHFGMEYALYPRPSSISIGVLDITVRYQDGFTFTCRVSMEDTAGYYFTDCNEENFSISP
jgi:hypothetical protein